MADEGLPILPDAESLQVLKRRLIRPAIAVAVKGQAKGIGLCGSGQPDFEPIATVRLDAENRAGFQVEQVGIGQLSGQQFFMCKRLLALLDNPLKGRQF
ncbi:MAG TPA: hypothetical protein PLL53_20695 [Saprospiraceae bacterium]|nr:hypothetical protein [Saprospiraceae bacterium]